MQSFTSFSDLAAANGTRVSNHIVSTHNSSIVEITNRVRDMTRRLENRNQTNNDSSVEDLKKRRDELQRAYDERRAEWERANPRGSGGGYVWRKVDGVYQSLYASIYKQSDLS